MEGLGFFLKRDKSVRKLSKRKFVRRQKESQFSGMVEPLPGGRSWRIWLRSQEALPPLMVCQIAPGYDMEPAAQSVVRKVGAGATRVYVDFPTEFDWDDPPFGKVLHYQWAAVVQSESGSTFEDVGGGGSFSPSEL
jgi:hypothetical protein